MISYAPLAESKNRNLKSQRWIDSQVKILKLFCLLFHFFQCRNEDEAEEEEEDDDQGEDVGGWD